MTFGPLTGKALQASELSTAEINIFDGAVRSGKTIGTLYDYADFAITGPPGLFLMSGRTSRTVINNLVLPIQQMLGPNLVSISMGSGTASICGREVLLVGANNEQARTKVQGLTLASAYVDEAAIVPESFFDMVTTRLSIRGARMWASCNPEGPKHWLKVKWLDRAKLWLDHDGVLHDHRDEFERLHPDDPARPLDVHRFSFLLDDNPYLDPEYIARRKASYAGLFYERMIRGQWANADGVVYASFTPTRHVIAHNKLPDMERVLGLGIDWGTTNATRGVLLGMAGGKLYVLDEWVPPLESTPGELSQDLQAWLAQRPQWQPESIYVDPSAKAFKLQLFRDDVGHIVNGDNKVDRGIGIVSSLMSSDRMLISDRCESLLGEIPGYVWDKKASEAKGKDIVLKANDHSVDGWRYVVATSEHIWRHHITID
ncbi:MULTISPECIES: phage terminase large subunit [Rhodococcus]|uniref:phage terminase large subunit n=1 Tax=Rhodococcus TaxID=1827 RepID=UPI00167E026B|nr:MULTISPECIES: phage terminase large subunit [Rhodococcus]